MAKNEIDRKWSESDAKWSQRDKKKKMKGKMTVKQIYFWAQPFISLSIWMNVDIYLKNNILIIEIFIMLF